MIFRHKLFNSCLQVAYSTVRFRAFHGSVSYHCLLSLVGRSWTEDGKSSPASTLCIKLQHGLSGAFSMKFDCLMPRIGNIWNDGGQYDLPFVRTGFSFFILAWGNRTTSRWAKIWISSTTELFCWCFPASPSRYAKGLRGNSSLLNQLILYLFVRYVSFKKFKMLHIYFHLIFLFPWREAFHFLSFRHSQSFPAFVYKVSLQGLTLRG